MSLKCKYYGEGYAEESRPENPESPTMTQTRINELVSTLGLTEMNLESGLFQVVNVSDVELGEQPVNN
ncbi:MAG: hypothetical protein VCA12_06260, partial [Pseudomonadales bacterium]